MEVQSTDRLVLKQAYTRNVRAQKVKCAYPQATMQYNAFELPNIEYIERKSKQASKPASRPAQLSSASSDEESEENATGQGEETRAQQRI